MTVLKRPLPGFDKFVYTDPANELRVVDTGNTGLRIALEGVRMMLDTYGKQDTRASLEEDYPPADVDQLITGAWALP